MIHIVSFSGGKDSTALILWAKENLAEFRTIHCATNFEHPLTNEYIEHINQTLLDGQLITVKSSKYAGFEDLVLQRKIIPGIQSRFCTQELKIFPMHEYIVSLDDECTTYQGVRRDESVKRSKMKPEEWVDDAGGYLIKRPLFEWTAEQCFDIHKKYNVEPNPLYKMGMRRVGCWPCVFTGRRQMRESFRRDPELLGRLSELERKLNEMCEDSELNPRLFFRSDFIPQRFCSKSTVTKSGETVRLATVEDVYDYLMAAEEDQMDMFPDQSCMSVYSICE